MTRPLLKIAGYAVAIIAVYLLIAKMGWLPSPASWFRAAPVTIDETPIIVSRIRALSELSSLSVQDEVVVTQIKPSGTAKQIISMMTPGTPPALDHLVLVVKGELQLGTDLKGLTEKQVFVSGDSISIRLPPATVLLAQINPSQTETFIEEGDWTPEQVTQLKIKARDQLIERARQKGLLQKANERSLKIMEDFLKTLGFTKTSVRSQ
ncbi:MAG TPA: DUF4230 domain-containing protein [Flavihumibacter sp.]|nr:DUF4230 domain-containing protein [Flavihumibacter sp.]HQD10585.1 DUF4230 domain-containing protein [Flavihumibacter sp.]